MDQGAVEAAVFRPQTGYSNSLEEEAAALMESLGNNHAFLDGNKRIAFTAADVFLRRNGFYIETGGEEGHAFIEGSMERHKFRFPHILDWIRRHIKPIRWGSWDKNVRPARANSENTAGTACPSARA